MGFTAALPQEDGQPDYRENVRRLIRAGNRRRQIKSQSDGFVYFIQAESGPVKIGRALQPSSRLAELQVGNHEVLTLLAVVRGGRALERAYHEQFAEHRKVGEWFSPAPPILAEITRLKGE